MSNPVKSFLVGNNPINKSDIFTSGDTITGQISLELSKNCQIKSLCVKLKGKAEVKWIEHYGRTMIRYHKKEKYFSIKQVIIEEGQGNCVGLGSHVFPFTFQIPSQDLPSSFIGKHGKIQYTVEANLSRYMRMDTKTKQKFTLVRKETLNSDPSLMNPQHSISKKKMNVFTSGTTDMDVTIPQTGFYPGQDIKVVACIKNTSSHEIKPKYCLYEKCSYFAMRKRKLKITKILKEVGDPIPPLAGQTVTRILTIPHSACASILNCNILKLEYRIKVCLDVKYGSNPEVKFPIVILPALQEPDEGERLPFYPTLSIFS